MNQDSDDDEKLDLGNDNLTKRTSAMQPGVNQFFSQTADKNKENDNVFEKANREVDADYFKQEPEDDNLFESVDKSVEEGEQKEGENQPVFVYKKNDRGGLPPMHKSKSKVSRASDAPKKLTKPPKPQNALRHSVLEKPDLVDLFGGS